MRGSARLQEIREPINIVLPCRSKIRKWAFDNAYMLAFVFTLFVITWIVVFIIGVEAYAS